MPRFRRRRRVRFRRRRYGRRRRYAKKRVNNKPWGKTSPNGFSWPRRARFALPIKRTSLLKTTYYEEVHNPLYAPYVSDPPSTTPAAIHRVAYWLFNPFHWTYPIGPYNYLNGVGVNADLSSIGATATHNPMGLPLHAYRWRHEVETDHMEYNPLFVKYSIRVTPHATQTWVPSRCGVFITARDKDNNYVVPQWNGVADHTEAETWEAWPGGRYIKLRPTINNGPTGKTFKGTLVLKDFQGVGSAAEANKNWYQFALNSQPGIFPVICLWYANSGQAAANHFRVSVRFTLFFRARRLSQLDPLEQRKIIPTAEFAEAKATIATLEQELVRLRNQQQEPLGSLAFPREFMTTSTTQPPTSPATPLSELPMSPSDLYYTEWIDNQDEPDSPTPPMEDPL